MAISTERSSSISKVTFKITIGILFGFAITSVIGRLCYRIHARRSLRLDDNVVLVGAICLCVATGMIYKYCEFIFLVDAMRSHSHILSKANADQVRILFETPYAVLHALFAFTWTTIFAVKFSFLIFFKQLINHVTRLHNYYWIVGIITSLSWLFMVVEPLVLCSEPDKSVVKCVPAEESQVAFAMTCLTNSLDIFTDILIISIPILILRKAKIKKRQKFALSIFLCLSIVMIVIAIIRILRTSYFGGIGPVWQMFWQGLEPSVALIMASITAFRSIFVSQEIRERNRKRLKAPPRSWIQRAKRRKVTDEETDLWDISQHQEQPGQFPSIPRATFTHTKKCGQGHDQQDRSTSTDGSTTLGLEERGLSADRERERQM